MGLLDYADAAGRKFFGLLSQAPDNAKQMALAAYQLATDPNARRAAMSRLPKAFDESKSGRQMFDEAMNVGPSGLLGKIVWHGSPHKFDKFDASKIGTGEGAQAYGHGVYLADSPSVAGSYVRAGRDVGFTNYDDVNRLADKAFAQAGGDKAAAMKILEDAATSTKGDAKRMNLALARKSIEEGTHSSGIYKADLPDEWIPKMLDWDKPISQQPKEVVDGFRQMLKDQKYLGPNDNGPRQLNSALKAWKMERAGMSEKDSGNLFWQAVNDSVGSPDKAAEYFRNAGVPGIRYLDGGSRSAGQGSYNYVVFPGLEDQIKILERNGIPLQGLLK